MKLELLNPYYIEPYLARQQEGIATLELEKDQVLLWKDAVTDRKQSDVERVKELLEKGWQNFTDEEKEEWSSSMKGALNTSDLERIQNNVQLLSDVLELDLSVEDVPELPDVKFYDQLLINIEEIRSAYCVHQTTPDTPAAPLNTFRKWNDIEHILFDVYKILLNNFHYYCGGEIYAGNETGLLL